MPTPAPISLIASDGFVNVSDFIPPASSAGSMPSGMTVPEAMAVLEEAQARPESVELLSKSLDTPKLMKWGVESGKMAGPKLSPADASALAKAESILASGDAVSTPAGAEQAGAAAAEAAANSGHAGPGGFMAQAIAFAAPLGALAATGNPASALVAATVQGAVMLSAAAVAEVLPVPVDPATLQTIEDPATLEGMQSAAAVVAEAPPPPAAEQFAALKPFIDLGKQVAAGA